MEREELEVEEEEEEEDEDRLSAPALARIRDLCEQFVMTYPKHFLTEEGVTVSQRSGICTLNVDDIYLLHEESVQSYTPAECGFAITDAGICVKEFREEWARCIPYGELLCKKIHSTLNYEVSADDTLLAQYMKLDGIIVVPKLVDLFINIQRIVQRDYDGMYEKAK